MVYPESPASIPGSLKWAPTQYAVMGLGSILSEVRLNDSTAAKVYDKIEDLHGSMIPAYQLIHGLIKILPDRRDALVMMMRTGLVTDDVDFVAHAASGLYEWLRATKDSSSQLRPPPDDLIREIGVTIATRRKGMLDQSLQIADWIFLKGTLSQKVVILGSRDTGTDLSVGRVAIRPPGRSQQRRDRHSKTAVAVCEACGNAVQDWCG